MTADNFDIFHRDFQHIQVSSMSTGSLPVSDQLAAFMKGIKRDPAVFPTIKSIKKWDPFKRSFKATAASQDVADCLDTNYAPTAANLAVFRKKKKYMYSVLLAKVEDPTLKAIVIASPPDQVPGCWKKMVEAAESSVTAELTSTALMKYIMNARLDDGKWKGTSKDFIIHFCDQIRKHDDLCLTQADRFSDHMKKQFLQSSVDTVEEFRNVRTVAQQTSQASTTGMTRTFEEYKALLIDTADIYDDKRAARRRPHRAMNHDLTDMYDGYVDEDPYDIDTDIDTIYANAVRMRQGMVPSETFIQLSQDGRRLWRRMNDTDRLLVLGQEAKPIDNVEGPVTRQPRGTPSDDGGRGRGAFSRERDRSSSGRGRGTFSRERDRKVNFRGLDQSTTDTDTTADSTTDGETESLIVSACEQYGLDYNNLCARAAEQRTELNKQKHEHWKPPKKSSLPPADPRRMLAHKTEINIGGIPYTAKKAGTAPHPADVVIDGVAFSVM